MDNRLCELLDCDHGEKEISMRVSLLNNQEKKYVVERCTFFISNGYAIKFTIGGQVYKRDIENMNKLRFCNETDSGRRTRVELFAGYDISGEIRHNTTRYFYDEWELGCLLREVPCDAE
eukprot:TRINITY_DN12392_c0_g1_i1.p1 TRINITY_DN12392_c0_g1~~TRINITY_DN12392_c0_g1_i1.p1  ORF type:complete len:119 (+),score=13.76 TRINITY_DN12392_c0_g1_i1:108-464(+)